MNGESNRQELHSYHSENNRELARGSPKRVNEPSVVNCRQRGGLIFLFRRAFRADKFDLS
jgi:hypothetical protein